MGRKTRLSSGWIAISVVAWLLLCAPTLAGALTCRVQPDRVIIGISYHGARITLDGEYSVGQDLIVEILSPPEKTELKYKGKVAGFLWMKLGSMTFENLPSIYMLFSTRPLDALLEPAVQAQQEIGYPALKAKAVIHSQKKGFDRHRWINEFFRFKEKEALYVVRPESIRAEKGHYHLDIDWPYQAPPGEYTVKVLAVENGLVKDRTHHRILVADDGLIRDLSRLARNRPALYGLLAIVVAIAVGIGVGVVFKRAGGH